MIQRLKPLHCLSCHGIQISCVDNGGPSRAFVLLPVDNGGRTPAFVLLPIDNGGRTPAFVLIDNSGRTPTLVPLSCNIKIVSVLIRLQCRYLRRRYRLLRCWPRDHRSTLPNPSRMRKQDLLTIVADPLFDNDIICILLRKTLSAFTLKPI
jgi:hypothetical protein